MAERRKTNQNLMKSVEKLTNVVDSIGERLEQIENRLNDTSDDFETSDVTGDNQRGLCEMPVVPDPIYPDNVAGERLDLIRHLRKKWVNHTVLHYYLFDQGPNRGTSDDMNVVREAFDAWKDVGIGLEFTEVDDISEAELRIGFKRGDGSWSYVGRDVLNIGQSLRTMNFGWKLAGNSGGGDDIDTALHEIGHSLGFHHEHQNPNSGIEWNEEAVYRDLAGSPNFWPRDKTYHNIIRKLPVNDVEGSDWDPDSIMHYPFKGGLIERPATYRQGLSPAPGLSETDVFEVKKFYPGDEDSGFEELSPFQVKRLSLSPGEQVNYRINVDSTRNFRISTFGESDTVMVLFEKVGDDFRYLDGDDDSGTDLNANIVTRLRPSREYVLRIRLYSQQSEGDTAVFMW